MDLHFFFFQLGPAIELIFNLNYIPQKEDFKELTPELYKKLQQKVSDEEMRNLDHQKILAFMPENEKVFDKALEVYGNNYLIVGDEEVALFERTANVIENYCKESGKSFNTLTDKLKYVASILPDVFSKDTPYAKYAKKYSK